MNTDDKIKSFIKEFQPVPSDSEDFMNRLNNRLDAAEEAKKYHKETLKRFWTASIIAFIVGGAIGMFVLFVVLFRPASLTHLRLLLEGIFLRFLAFWPVFLVLAILFAAILIIIPIMLSGLYEKALYGSHEQ